jgi:hypothetical protein
MATFRDYCGRGGICFTIGFIAGVAPFLFMQYLPAMMTPGLEIKQPNLMPVLVTGSLIGLITTILFTKNFNAKEPQDIFFYALGIPAILIATVSNMGIQQDSAQQIQEVRTNARELIETTPDIDNIRGGNKKLFEIDPEIIDLSSLFISSAVAAQPKGAPISGSGYFLVIREFADAKSAKEEYKRLVQTRMKVEAYVPKDVRIIKKNSGPYMIAYTRFSNKSEAIKGYKLLKIYEPKLPTRIIKY